eukprot:TRINITY_DN197_c0_g3_i1.p1 TRINITY_DN197_c0_g3~~TRINITY_DN197_c0_g3_i1.p1  ORF type:complete len:463 (+),score=40.29 TRINITY_DN197_c0_g3_i1:46-1434(+)
MSAERARASLIRLIESNGKKAFVEAFDIVMRLNEKDSASAMVLRNAINGLRKGDPKIVIDTLIQAPIAMQTPPQPLQMVSKRPVSADPPSSTVNFELGDRSRILAQCLQRGGGKKNMDWTKHFEVSVNSTHETFLRVAGDEHPYRIHLRDGQFSVQHPTHDGGQYIFMRRAVKSHKRHGWVHTPTTAFCEILRIDFRPEGDLKDENAFVFDGMENVYNDDDDPLLPPHSFQFVKCGGRFYDCHRCAISNSKLQKLVALKTTKREVGYCFSDLHNPQEFLVHLRQGANITAGIHTASHGDAAEGGLGAKGEKKKRITVDVPSLDGPEKTCHVYCYSVPPGSAQKDNEVEEFCVWKGNSIVKKYFMLSEIHTIRTNPRIGKTGPIVPLKEETKTGKAVHTVESAIALSTNAVSSGDPQQLSEAQEILEELLGRQKFPVDEVSLQRACRRVKQQLKQVRSVGVAE